MKKKSPAVPTRDYLKLKQIIEAANLHATTASYLLANPDLFQGMPLASSKGIQRQFSLRQATQLAIGSHLVRAGFSIHDSFRIVQFAERTAQSNQSFRRCYDGNTLLYSRRNDSLTSPWELIVADECYMNVYNRLVADEDQHQNVASDLFFHVQTGMPTETFVLELAISQLKLNLSLIEVNLNRKFEITS